MSSIDNIVKKLFESKLESALDIDDMKSELLKYGDYNQDELSKMGTGEIIRAWTALSSDLKESERMEFATDSEAYEWAEENGYEVEKIQNGTGGKACICWMRKKISEALGSSEDYEYVFGELHPAFANAVMKVTGSGLDDASYDYYGDSFRGQGVVYFSSEEESDKKWESLVKELRKSAEEVGYEGLQLYDFEDEPTPPGAPVFAIRIYFRAEKSGVI